jgi:hypothetical protein
MEVAMDPAPSVTARMRLADRPGVLGWAVVCVATLPLFVYEMYWVFTSHSNLAGLMAMAVVGALVPAVLLFIVWMLVAARPHMGVGRNTAAQLLAWITAVAYVCAAIGWLFRIMSP